MDASAHTPRISIAAPNAGSASERGGGPPALSRAGHLFDQEEIATAPMAMTSTAPLNQASQRHRGEGRCPSGKRRNKNVSMVPSPGIHIQVFIQAKTSGAG